MAVQNFEINYSTSTLEMTLSWQKPRYFEYFDVGASPALTYKIKDISNVSSTLPDIETADETAAIQINEVGRKYKFSIQAFDNNGNGTLIVQSKEFLRPIHY